MEYRIDNQNNIPLNVFITTDEPDGWTSELKASSEQNGGDFLLLSIPAYGSANFNVDMTPSEQAKNGEQVEFRITVTPMDESAPYGDEFRQIGKFQYLTSCTGLSCITNEILNPSTSTVALMALGALLMVYWVYTSATNRATNALLTQEKVIEEILEEDDSENELSIPEPVSVEDEDDDLELLEELESL